VTRRTTKAAMLALVAAGAALGLTGCAGLTPGVAADVGDETITIEQTDDFAEGLCAFTEANGQQATSAETRRAALSTLIYAQLAHDNADDVEADQEFVEQSLSQVETAVQGLSEPERDDFLEDVRYVIEGDSIIQQSVVEQVQSSGGQLTEETGAAAQAELLTTWADEAGVEVDPRFGVWEGFQIEPKSGSISVPTRPDTDGAAAALPFLTCG